MHLPACCQQISDVSVEDYHYNAGRLVMGCCSYGFEDKGFED